MGVGCLYRGGYPVARGRGGGATDPPAAPERGATAPPSPVGGGDRVPLHFFGQEPRCKFKEKITLMACRPMGGDRVFFEIFQNGHIFLKFLFFKNIKKEKSALIRGQWATWVGSPPLTNGPDQQQADVAS